MNERRHRPCSPDRPRARCRRCCVDGAATPVAHYMGQQAGGGVPYGRLVVASTPDHSLTVVVQAHGISRADAPAYHMALSTFGIGPDAARSAPR